MDKDKQEKLIKEIMKADEMDGLYDDLFGGKSRISKKVVGKYQAAKAKVRYMKSEHKNRRCKNCTHLIKKQFNKKYYKCALIGDSASEASDIRVSYVCDKFKPHTPCK